jgi:hypothetical protein
MGKEQEKKKRMVRVERKRLKLRAKKNTKLIGVYTL